MILLGKGLLVLALAIYAFSLYPIVRAWVQSIKKGNFKQAFRVTSMTISLGSVVASVCLSNSKGCFNFYLTY